MSGSVSPSVPMATPVSAMGRPVLRPGLHVVRRDDQHLQLGLDDPDRLVVRDQPGLREALARPDLPAPAAVAPVLDSLAARGWLVDAAELRAEADRRRARRAPVHVQGDPVLVPAVARICAAADVAVTDPADGAPRLVVSRGEPRRVVADALMRQDVPHLWLAVFPGGVRVGPFVQPGRSACLRCVDAHLGDLDPRRATVLHQLDDEPRGGSPVDPALLTLGAAWAVRDLVRALDGDGPSLASTTVTVSADLEVAVRTWLRHPHCGCAWG